MKIAIFVIAIMVMCICPGRISEEKDLVSREQRHLKDCRFPKGKHGAVRTNGCIESTCFNGKWKTKMRTDICCYKQQAHEPNTVLDKIVSADNCSLTTIGCGAVAQLEINHRTCSTPASEQQVEKLEIILEQKFEQVTAKIEKVAESSGKQIEEIYKTVKEADKKIISIEDKVDGIKNNSNWQSQKVNHVIQKLEYNKLSIENQIQEINNTMETNSDDLMKKIDNNKISIEKTVKEADKKIIRIEDKVDDLKNTTNWQSEKVNHVIQKLNISIENNSDDLSDKVTNVVNQIQAMKMNLGHQIENATETSDKHADEINQKLDKKVQEINKNIETLENKMESLAQTVKDNIEDQAEMSLQMMRTLANLTQLLEKHSEEMPSFATKTPATTTTLTAPTTTTPMVEGVLITGGYGALTSTELFLPHSGKTCSLQSLPDNRNVHSLDVVSKKIILCGGGSGSSRTSCLEFLPTSSFGTWANYATLAQGRYAHTSHSFQGELIMMGGGKGTTEIIGKGTQYNLQQDTYYACSIPDQASTILTGGYSGSGNLKTVMEYNFQGFVKSLPDLATARHLHGCGSYLDNGNKVLVVAGGHNGAYLSSTELLTPGASAWTSGQSLPRTLGYPASVNMGTYFLLIGGWDGGNSRGKVLKFDGTWTEVGMMKNARYGAGAAKIEIPGEGGLLDIAACN